MKDFLGAPILVGSWLAGGGAGNKTGEYGMILHRVERIEPTMRLRRLDISYGSNGTPQLRSRTFTATSPQKYVVVEPSVKLETLFGMVEKGEPLTTEEANLISRWLHGSNPDLFR